LTPDRINELLSSVGPPDGYGLLEPFAHSAISIFPDPPWSNTGTLSALFGLGKRSNHSDNHPSISEKEKRLKEKLRRSVRNSKKAPDLRFTKTEGRTLAKSGASLRRKLSHSSWSGHGFAPKGLVRSPPQPRVGRHPDDTTPIPRPSHYYGRR